MFMHKDNPNRNPAPLGAWVRRTLTLLWATTLAYPMLGLLAMALTGQDPTPQHTRLMLVSALVSSMTLAILQMNLLGRMQHLRAKRRNQQGSAQ